MFNGQKVIDNIIDLKPGKNLPLFEAKEVRNESGTSLEFNVDNEHQAVMEYIKDKVRKGSLILLRKAVERDKNGCTTFQLFIQKSTQVTF